MENRQEGSVRTGYEWRFRTGKRAAGAQAMKMGEKGGRRVHRLSKI